jgi:hypothetical protein
MKLTISPFLIALFCTLSNATTGYDDVVFEDLPSHMEVGQQIRVSWYTPRDYVRTFAPVSLPLRYIANLSRARQTPI